MAFEFRRRDIKLIYSIVALERGIVHDVAAEAETSLSVHVYSPPLRVMSFYDEFGQIVTDRAAVEHGPSAWESTGEFDSADE